MVTFFQGELVPAFGDACAFVLLMAAIYKKGLSLRLFAET